ncbi:MAG TPA: 7-cyano-7-deazaguanine synthase QueC [bacterium]|nr:7-cyano-7-deazaguanine synthase QueC [bacterium]HOL67516.1 7-cyano-7-deazaguanine synthase QueC [bacterium]HPP11494.1 7-cyano-7-deazaguanine synthase QueC [bacterium]
MKAVCLISGGMDSYVAAAIAREEGYLLYGLTFNYGQKNRRELTSARKVAASLKMKKHWIVPVCLPVTGSSLTDPRRAVPRKRTASVPTTYVPARNTIFISHGLAYAEVIGAEAVFVGVNAIDYSGYPDCRPEYLRQFQRLIDLALKKTVKGDRLFLKAPLLFLSKAEIVKKGLALGLDFSLTWSCYLSGRLPCGSCPSCRLRARAFQQAGVRDPSGRGK